MTKRISDHPTDHKESCRLLLELSADDLAQARRARDHYIRVSHRFGLSNVEIGTRVGMSEARVRQIVGGAN